MAVSALERRIKIDDLIGNRPGEARWHEIQDTGLMAKPAVIVHEQITSCATVATPSPLPSLSKPLGPAAQDSNGPTVGQDLTVFYKKGTAHVFG